MYAEGEHQTKLDPKEEKVRVNCMSNRDCTKISFPAKWKHEGRVKTTLVAWTEDHRGAREIVEDRAAIDSYVDLEQNARYMCV